MGLHQFIGKLTIFFANLHIQNLFGFTFLRQITSKMFLMAFKLNFRRTPPYLGRFHRTSRGEMVKILFIHCWYLVCIIYPTAFFAAKKMKRGDL